MTDEELIAWKNGEWDQEWWDNRMVKIRAERGSYPDALMFLRADAEIKRLKDNEDTLNDIQIKQDAELARLRELEKRAGDVEGMALMFGSLF